ncbi:prepilin-type N-terminal cleavage/methylation domain-containing protein [Synechococcus sp. Cruz-9H2]|uniref:type II secretion system protein n=1 Tax=unclassified Synechococcus TaxID=2626047 RepID=UPI0020CFD617|nr:MULTISPECIES: prepilin-type N-terminal cleavage/methylation domain-containing protein [unclassified Synechococcus]MCP9820374.1 prepilin-type N-terminal cleavage/methylation domain-containing protein [Synechococcus sp. Cruz-9H2]MCP9844763.1 prepilin-type N-terminal cleavage/methylation domain-containing protein [Synechococcus sp. Edmonson 11F2]MCP9856804.1 prepilin-type N-terminal cleavage/methylation domain-containing protein [Synechococcus sp. Cruz-9C9]MCP9864171.1 prepilin-type N-terminal 
MSASTYRQRLVLQLLNQRQRRSGSADQGFTLIELLVVIVILGVLGGVGYGAYVGQLSRANQNTARVAVTAAAKNCAALLATAEQSSFVAGVDGTRVKFSGTCATGAQTFNVTAGEGTNSRSASAAIDAAGAVIPGA